MRNDDRTDELLILHAVKGNIGAFEELAKKYRDRIYAVCLMTVKNREDAADASQDALMKIYEKLPQFSFKSSFSTWVYTISRNAALDILRKKRPTIAESDEILLNMPCEMTVYASPEAAVENTELREELARNINELPDDMRTVLILRDVKGYSYAEIAQMTNITEGTVKSRISRARQRLSKLMNKYLETKR